MLMRSAALPVITIGLALGAVSGCSSSGQDEMAAPASTVRPAQMTERSQCDQLAQTVEQRMPTAKSYWVPGAEQDLSDAQELCHSGQEQEGMAKLNGILGRIDQEH